MYPVSKEEALAEIDRMVKRIVDGFHPEKIILFGSYARDAAGPDSDVDLLVVMHVSGSRKDVTIQIDRALIDRKLPLDVIVATPEDVERYRGIVGHIIKPALEEGRVLYERAA